MGWTSGFLEITKTSRADSADMRYRTNVTPTKKLLTPA